MSLFVQPLQDFLILNIQLDISGEEKHDMSGSREMSISRGTPPKSFIFQFLTFSNHAKTSFRVLSFDCPEKEVHMYNSTKKMTFLFISYIHPS